MKNVATQPWMYGLAIIAAMMVGCGGEFGDISVPFDLGGDANVNVTTGDVNVTNTTNVTQIQNVRIGDNISIQGGTTVDAAPTPTLTDPEGEEIVVAQEIPECIPVEEITEDQLIAVCIALQDDFDISDLIFVYVQFEGLEGATEIPVASLDLSTPGSVCFDISFLGDLGVDPIAALGDVEGVGNALNCIYQLDTTAGVTPEYTTLIVLDGDDCGDDNMLVEGFQEVIPR